MFKAMEKREHIPENEIGFKVEIPRKEGRDDLLSRVTALFLTVVTLAFSKFVLNDLILNYLNCC